MARQTDKLLRFAGIIAIGYLIFQQVGNAIYERISVGRPRLRINRLTGMGVEITFVLPVVNSTPISAPIDGLSGHIMYGNHILSQVVLNRPIGIMANNSTDLTFNAVLDFTQLGTSVVDIIESQEWLQSLHFKGQAVSNGIVIPFDKSFQFGVA